MQYKGTSIRQSVFGIFCAIAISSALFGTTTSYGPAAGDTAVSRIA